MCWPILEPTATTANPGGAGIFGRLWLTTPSRWVAKTSPARAVRSCGLATRRARLVGLDRDERGDVTAWSAEHDGYGALNPPVRHRRSVRLDSRLRRLEIVDCLETTGSHAFRLALHLGPDIDARMVGQTSISPGSTGTPRERASTLHTQRTLVVAHERSRPTRSSVGTPHVLGRSSRPGPLSEKDLAVDSVRTPSRRCSSSSAELGPRPPVAVNHRSLLRKFGYLAHPGLL